MVFVAGLGVSWVLFLRNKRDRQQDENNQEELQEKYIELQNHFEKVREKLSREENNTKSLITDISHQLKTPIASLKMSCELAGSAVQTCLGLIALDIPRKKHEVTVCLYR